jgi:hypothetical protein
VRTISMSALALTAILSACGQPIGVSSPGDKNPGRYTGIGVVSAGRLWSQRAITTPASDTAAATLADDEHIIVVVDTHSGEVRQCGDQSGFCVTMNPWSGAAPAGLPAKLKRHATDLDIQIEAVPKDTTPKASPAAEPQ